MKKLIPVDEIMMATFGNGEDQVAKCGEIIAMITGAAELFEEVTEIGVEIASVVKE